ncbi:MAG: metal-dependent hydrolase [Rhodospirillales bacterium]
MDPVTQGALGAALPKAMRGRSDIVIAGLFGFVGGLAADLDVLIRSDTDPLLFLEYHRQFTHSLIFIPVGGLICALFLRVLLGKRCTLSFMQSLLFCSLGYGTHTFLDASTSYGTMLLWPFSDTRFSWSIISVVDPLFTVPLLTLVVISALKRRPKYARIGLAWAAFYLCLGAYQHGAALDAARQIAAGRGHETVRIEVKPSFANIVVWKSIYETAGAFYVDAVRASVRPRIFPGGTVPKLDMARDFPRIDSASRQAEDVRRFRRFSDGFVAKDPDRPNRIFDVRYSFIPNDLTALWSIDLSPDTNGADPVRFLTHRESARKKFGVLLRMIFH